jgi:hypothetical protein
MSNPEIDALVSKWGEDNVSKAFWLQEHIKTHGVEGIHFMTSGADGGDSAESHMRQVGSIIIRSTVKGTMDSTY